jgi:hypothetical protein
VIDKPDTTTFVALIAQVVVQAVPPYGFYDIDDGTYTVVGTWYKVPLSAGFGATATGDILQHLVVENSDNVYPQEPGNYLLTATLRPVATTVGETYEIRIAMSRGGTTYYFYGPNWTYATAAGQNSGWISATFIGPLSINDAVWVETRQSIGATGRNWIGLTTGAPSSFHVSKLQG